MKLKYYFFLVLLISFSALAEISVITNPNNSITEIDINTLKKLYLGKRKSFEDGTTAIVFEQDESSPVRDLFHSKVTNKSASQLKAYWSSMMFTGKAQPPESAGDDSGVISKVSSIPNAVGYVDSGSVNDSVKVILTIP